MKKTTRTLLGIGGAFCLIGALLFGIGFVSGGTKYVHATNLNTMNAQSDQDAKENHFTLEKTELSDFNSLNINLKNSERKAILNMCRRQQRRKTLSPIP